MMSAVFWDVIWHILTDVSEMLTAFIIRAISHHHDDGERKLL
jgi:hypothetical protein